MQDRKKANLLKKLRAASARIDELSRAPLQMVPLKKRVFAGHWRHLTVRADVLRSSIGEAVASIVANCDHWVLGKKKEPKSYNCVTEVLYGKNTVCIPGQYLQPLSEEGAEKAGFSPSFLRKWFDKETTTINAGTKTFERHRYFPKVPAHMVEFTFKPAFIIEAHTPNPDRESELAKLYRFMDANDGWKKVGQTNRDEWSLSLHKKRTLEEIARREAREVLNEI
jgi:hypothetical protein